MRQVAISKAKTQEWVKLKDYYEKSPLFQLLELVCIGENVQDLGVKHLVHPLSAQDKFKHN